MILWRSLKKKNTRMKKIRKLPTHFYENIMNHYRAIKMHFIYIVLFILYLFSSSFYIILRFHIVLLFPSYYSILCIVYCVVEKEKVNYYIREKWHFNIPIKRHNKIWSSQMLYGKVIMRVYYYWSFV